MWNEQPLNFRKKISLGVSEEIPERIYKWILYAYSPHSLRKYFKSNPAKTSKLLFGWVYERICKKIPGAIYGGIQERRKSRKELLKQVLEDFHNWISDNFLKKSVIKYLNKLVKAFWFSFWKKEHRWWCRQRAENQQKKIAEILPVGNIYNTWILGRYFGIISPSKGTSVEISERFSTESYEKV